jgi:RNA polymerase sigma-70 factor (ECF subfamily)
MYAEESRHTNTPELPPARGDAPEEACSADGLLVERLRRGDAEAGYVLFRDYYPSVYRYLFWLTERSEQAEDLAQETFVRAWRHLDRFDPCGSLRAWLHRIAHREFLRSVRRQTPASLEVVGEVAAPEATAFTEAVELRQILRKLPAEQREVVLLHDLEGYSSREIAPIVGAPASTVRRRLAQARERLRQELGEDDLTYVNEPAAPMRQWAWLPLDQMHALETRLVTRATGDRAAPGQGARQEDGMERREFLRHAAAGAVGLMLPEAEKEVVDSRLTQKVTLTFKGVALSDLCEHLWAETEVHLAAGPSVADEKVTLFCEKTPLRDVMRQLARPFGYTWVRSARMGEYHYELTQDLRSQLLEEELRSRDRNAALLALEREIDRYRPYLELSPDEALARSKTAASADKRLLQALATTGWGPLHIYFRLSPQQLEALRAGQQLVFSTGPGPSEQPLPRDLVHGVLQSLRDWRLIKSDHGFGDTSDLTDPRGVALTAIPEVGAKIQLGMPQSELGQFTLEGQSGFFVPHGSNMFAPSISPLAVGRSPAVLKPENARATARLAHDAALRSRVTVQPQPSCGSDLAPGFVGAPPSWRHAGETPALPRKGEQLPLPASGRGSGGEVNPPKVTSADVLEALHDATGLPIVADYYTHLYAPEAVSARNIPLFDALNDLADAMHVRWARDSDGGWLQFRSASYYNDRLKEVPNRLLSRWATRRYSRGSLTLDDLVEIVQLPDPQLNADEMAEGARECFGLAEWDLARDQVLRQHLRYLAAFTRDQRQRTMSAAGLPFSQMTLSQQQQFISLALYPLDAPLQSLEEMTAATLRVEYTVPGWFRWGKPDVWGYTRWVVPLEPGPQSQRVLRPPGCERTREAALQALRRVDPQVRDAVLEAMGRSDPRLAAALQDEEGQIFPTDLSLAIVYIPGGARSHLVHVLKQSNDMVQPG